MIRVIFPQGRGGVTDFVLFALILFDLVVSALVVNVIEFTATEDLRSAVLIRSGLYLRRHSSQSHLCCAVDAVILF